ncbi:MAG: hypothetical protein ABID71_08085, partial [Chloroflexota bacterium]
MVVKESKVQGSVSRRGVMDFNRLLEKARAYLPAEKMAVLEDAYHFAAEKHQGQVRLSGEPFL